MFPSNRGSILSSPFRNTLPFSSQPCSSSCDSVRNKSESFDMSIIRMKEIPHGLPFEWPRRLMTGWRR